MDNGWLEQKRFRKQPEIGDLVICVDAAKKDATGHNKRFVGLVLDKSITICKIQVVDSGEELYWPLAAIYLWKETK